MVSLFPYQQHIISLVSFLIWTLLFFIGFDLNLPLDEYGAVDFSFLQNLAGKIECFFDSKINLAGCFPLFFLQ